MKIVCIGRNYGEHARELGNAIPDEPVVFLKPPSALIPATGPITLPAFSKDIHHEIELVYHIERNPEGKAIASHVTIGLDLTARDLQQALKSKGLPWEKAKAFDGSAYVAQQRISIADLEQENDLEFRLERNGTIVQTGNSNEMIFDVKTLVAHVERYMALLPGDLLFTGTPAGVGPLTAGDHLVGFLMGKPFFDLKVEA